MSTMNLSSISVLVCLMGDIYVGWIGGSGRGEHGPQLGMLIGAIIGIACGFVLLALERAATHRQGMKAVIPYAVFAMVAVAAPFGSGAVSFLAGRGIAEVFR